jgi:hypothetical protein
MDKQVYILAARAPSAAQRYHSILRKYLILDQVSVFVQLVLCYMFYNE